MPALQINLVAPLPYTQFKGDSIHRLNIDNVTKGSCFTENFKQLLSKLENANLQHLVLSEGTSQNYDYDSLAEELITLVETNKLSFLISLPEPYRNTKLQQKIDQLTSDFQHQKNSTTFQEASSNRSPVNNTSTSLITKRTRPRTSGLSLNIDTNLQSEQTQTKQTETTIEMMLDSQLSNQMGISCQATAFSNLVNKEAFIQLCLGESSLSQEKYLLSKQEAENIWDSLFNYQTIWRGLPQWAPAAITLEAAQQILYHWRQFQSGIEPNHLASGFNVPNSIGMRFDGLPPDLSKFNGCIKVLDYDSTHINSIQKDPLGIHCYSAAKPQALAHQLLETYIQHAKKIKDNSDKLPLLLWDKLNAETKPYDREAVRLFSQHLVILTSLSNKTTIFHKLFFKNDEFQKKDFDFFFSNFRRIAALFPDTASLADPDKQAAKKTLQEYFTEELTSQAIDLCKSYVVSLEKSPKALKKHILYLLLEKDTKNTELLIQLKLWHSELSLSNANLNALVQVYQTHGGPGLEKLFALWRQWHAIKITTPAEEKSLLKILQEICFKNFQSYTPLLDPAYASTIELIKGFYLEKNQGHYYWETLIKQHYAAVPEDDLPSLVNAFKAFTLQLQDLGLTFNQFPCQLQNVKSLPVTLARILALLKNCRPEDRARQWACHDQLNFTNNGVMQALYESSLFVIPEMQTHANSNIPSYVGDTKHYLKPSVNPIGQKNSELLRDFFRFIASQNHALSLEFYQQAEQAISSKKFSEKLRNNLYRCLAATTTGSTNSLFITDTDLALAEWKKLLETIQNITEKILKKIPFIVRVLIPTSKLEQEISKIIAACLSEEGSFPLPIFQKLMQSALGAISAEEKSYDELETLFDNVKDALSQLTQCVNHFKNDSIYRGMRFYDDDYYYKNAADATFLFHYHKVVITIINSALAWYLQLHLISLISTFHLKSEDINQIIGLIEEIQQEQLVSKGSQSAGYLFFLDQYLIKNKVINKNEEKKLTCTDLIDFLNIYKENIDEVFSCIKSKFNKYLDVNGLTALEKKAFSEQLKENIKIQFPETKDRHIISCFLAILTDDVAKPEKHFQIISALYKTLEKNEQKDFLKCLQQLTKINASNEPRNLADILAKIYEKQHTRDFIYFIQKDQKKNIEHSDNLVNRLACYLELSHTNSTNNKQLLVLLERLLLFPAEKTDLTVLRTLMSKLDTLLGYDTGYASALFEFSNNFISQLEDAQKPIIASIVQFTNNLHQLAIETSATLDLKSTLTNLLYYSKKTPFKLDKWLDAINQQVSKPAHKTILLHILSILLSQVLEFDENHFATLITLLQEQEAPKNLLTTLQNSYQCPPYPPLAKLLQWWNETKQTNNSELLPQRYKEFIVTPYPRDALNGFHIEFAKKQKELFKGVIFSEENLLQLASEVNSARSRLPKKILHDLNDIKNKSQTTENLHFQDLVKLVASLTELLYRSKGIEINTTQYLTIIAMLQSTGHVSSEIATGEGKSRIMMLLAASQAFLGKTCDFVTSNMPLAQRDYIEYSPFFNMLGVTTQLISADSPPTNYQQNAIHFTDMTNLSLFRNKAHTHQQLDKVLDPNKNQRSLLLDEADRSYFDLAQTRFNYSDSASKDIHDMEWIYPLLMKFILLPEHEDLFYNDIQTHTKNFISFAKTKTTVVESQRLDSLATAQLETWLESAMKAKKLKLNQHFIIKPDVDIPPPQGPQIASMAYVLHNNRLCQESQYSEGVHQCLHALLEMQRRQEVGTADSASMKTLAQCKTPFYSNPEKRIICSTNSYDLLADYQGGNLLGVTGTLGCQLERQEAAQLYKKQGLANMAFIEVPRHQPLRRLDNPPRLAANPQRQATFLMEYIRKAYAKNQAVLLISENESKSTQLQQTIAALNQTLPEAQRLPTENFQRVSSELSSEQERQLINQAGQAGMITFSTNMLGRGTDIVLKNRAKEAGLLVLLSYLPDKRDYQQIIGRSGRYGAAGESRIVIKKEDINSNYYLNSDSWQQREWQKRTWKTRFYRLIGFLLGNTYTNYQKNFSFDSSYRDKWFNFIQKVPELYKKTHEKISDLCKTPKLAWDELVKKLKTELDLYQDNMNTHYANDITSKANSTTEPLSSNEKDENIIKLLEKSPKEKLSPEHQTSKQIRVHGIYDPALDGRSKVYNKMFLETGALLAGNRPFLASWRATLRGEGILFADTRAWLAGERPLLANTRESIKSLKLAFFSKPKPTPCPTDSPPTPDIENVECNVRPLGLYRTL